MSATVPDGFAVDGTEIFPLALRLGISRMK